MRVLIVEDEGKIAGFIKKTLEAEYFVADIAEDGEKGSRLARENDYDIIILDNVLPRKSGLEVCKEVRLAGKSVPILVLSVKSESSQKVDFLDAGADDYLIKPFALEELLARMRALLRRPKEIENEVIKIDDIILDSSSGTVVRRGKPIRLTRKEFMLLRYLFLNRGVVVSRSMILEHVWDMNVDVFSNTIDSHILSLRKKLDDRKKEKVIQTVPGRGYKVEEY